MSAQRSYKEANQQSTRHSRRRPRAASTGVIEEVAKAGTGTSHSDLGIRPSIRQKEIALQPYVEQIRQHYFGSPHVPFHSYDKAVEWLRGQGDEPDHIPSVRMEQIIDTLKKTMQQFRKTDDVGWSHEYRTIPFLSKYRLRARAYGVPVAFDGVLFKLWKFALKMVDTTGSDQAECVAHVLVGTPLLVSRHSRHSTYWWLRSTC